MSLSPSELGPHPLSRKQVWPPPLGTKGGGTQPPGRREGVGESQFGRLKKKPSTLSTLWLGLYRTKLAARVSFETSFNSKQPKLEPKLVSALSETKHLFRLFRFFTETESFDVSIEPKQTEDQPKQFDREYILLFFTENLGFFWFFWFFSVFSVFSVFFVFFVFFGLFRNSLFRLFRFYTETESSNWTKTNRRPTQTV